MNRHEMSTIETMGAMIVAAGLPVLKIEEEDDVDLTHACVTVTDRVSVDLVPDHGVYKAMVVRMTGNGDDVAFIFSNLYKWDALRWVEVLHREVETADAEGPAGGAA